MSDLAVKNLLEILQERQDRLALGVSKLKAQHANANVPEAYKDARCTHPNQWIYLYPDGHEELVEINSTSMTARKIKEY